MKRTSLHFAIGLAVTGFLTLAPVAVAQARTDPGQAPAVHAPLATSLAAGSADVSPAKSKDDCKRDCDDRDRKHGDDRDKKHGDKKHDDDKKHGDDRRHGDKKDRDRDRRDRDDHDRDACDDREGLLTGLLCLLLG